MVDVVVHQCGQQVVGQRNRIEVTGKVKVDVLHGHHLGITAPSRAAFHTKHRAERGLAQRNHGALANAVERITQTHRGGGFTFARWRRADGRHQHQLAVGGLVAVEPLQVDLGLVVTVGLQRFGRDTKPVLRHLDDGLQGGGLGDFDV